MKFKEFLLNAVAEVTEDKEFSMPKIKQLNKVNDILIKFALKEFNKKSQLSDNYFIKYQDIDQKVMLFSDKFRKSNNEEILVKLASLLDEMTEKNLFWYVIPYDKLYVSEKNQIVFNWFKLRDYCISDQTKIPREIRLKYQNVMSKKLNSGFIKFEMLNGNLVKDAFWPFLIKTLYPKVPANNLLPFEKYLKVAISKYGLLPEEKYCLMKINNNRNHFNTCKDIVIQLFNEKKNSVCVPKKDKTLIWDFAFHTEQGRNKKSIQNEDSYAVIPAKDKKSLLFMIADGVSTANIGRGKIISSTIQETIDDKHDEIIAFMENNADSPSREWMENCQNYIVKILTDINNICVKKLNRYVKKLNVESANNSTNNSTNNSANNSTLDQQPMSSTVIIGFVSKNRAIFGHVGDSHVFYIYKKTIMCMNEEHNVMADRIADYIEHSSNHPFQNDKTDKQLSRVIPLIDYNVTENKFTAVSDLKNQIDFTKFYPEENSVIIAATDGLIDSLGSTGNIFQNEKNILQAYLEAESKSANTKDVARIIGRKADEQAGVDNITLIILKNKLDILSDGIKKKKDGSRNQKRKDMKKIG